jgi:hypothetical protein
MIAVGVLSFGILATMFTDFRKCDHMQGEMVRDVWGIWKCVEQTKEMPRRFIATPTPPAIVTAPPVEVTRVVTVVRVVTATPQPTPEGSAIETSGLILFTEAP